MIEYLGYICAVLIGLILGLMGAGGSILTVPVLVYIMGFNPITATAYSLFIVGTTSVVGTVKNIQNNTVDVKTGLLYAIPSLIGVYIARMFIVPALPPVLFSMGSVDVLRDTFIMILFSIIMAFAAYAMLREGAEVEKEHRRRPWLALIIFFAGILVGMVGAGGGFLFIPLLIYAANLHVKQAMATSLMIIAINSLIGFTGDLGHTQMDWPFLLTFSALAVIGILLGIYLTRFIHATWLKRVFGWFVLVMAIVILAEEIL